MAEPTCTVGCCVCLVLLIFVQCHTILCDVSSHHFVLQSFVVLYRPQYKNNIEIMVKSGCFLLTFCSWPFLCLFSLHKFVFVVRLPATSQQPFEAAFGIQKLTENTKTPNDNEVLCNLRQNEIFRCYYEDRRKFEMSYSKHDLSSYILEVNRIIQVKDLDEFW